MSPSIDVAVENSKYFNDDDVVISGISGRFPNCDTVEEFKEKLFNGTDIFTEGESRWPDGKLHLLFLYCTYIIFYIPLCIFYI